MKGLIGKKLGMTQSFGDDGVVRGVTLIEAGPCYVAQIRRTEKEGYAAVQLGFGEVKPRRLAGGQLGHLQRNKLPPLRHLREFRISEEDPLQEGQVLRVADVFQVGDWVDVTSTSKGKGYQGGVKRHGFRGGPRTHGQSDRTRAPGSSGSTTTPGRVYKGTRRPGHMGNVRVSQHNLEVVLVDAERNLIGVFGSVPGAAGSLVLIKEARKQ